VFLERQFLEWAFNIRRNTSLLIMIFWKRILSSIKADLSVINGLAICFPPPNELFNRDEDRI